jgi:putative spermidine/putrescine transport system ATP-binding protein
VSARVRDVEYMGSYRTLLLNVGNSGVAGRARIEATGESFAIGDEVVAWWHPHAQRVVAV